MVTDGMESLNINHSFNDHLGGSVDTVRLKADMIPI